MRERVRECSTEGKKKREKVRAKHHGKEKRHMSDNKVSTARSVYINSIVINVFH